jgi:hypothetical protein
MQLDARMDLIRNFSPEQFTRALESWDWIGVADKSPMFTSPFGDVFLRGQTDFWYLDTLEGTPHPAVGQRRARCVTCRPAPRSADSRSLQSTASAGSQLATIGRDCSTSQDGAHGCRGYRKGSRE